MCQGFSHFSVFLHHFEKAKLAASSIRVIRRDDGVRWKHDATDKRNASFKCFLKDIFREVNSGTVLGYTMPRPSRPNNDTLIQPTGWVGIMTSTGEGGGGSGSRDLARTPSCLSFEQAVSR